MAYMHIYGPVLRAFAVIDAVISGIRGYTMTAEGRSQFITDFCWFIASRWYLAFEASYSVFFYYPVLVGFLATRVCYELVLYMTLSITLRYTIKACYIVGWICMTQLYLRFIIYTIKGTIVVYAYQCYGDSPELVTQRLNLFSLSYEELWICACIGMLLWCTGHKPILAPITRVTGKEIWRYAKYLANPWSLYQRAYFFVFLFTGNIISKECNPAGYYLSINDSEYAKLWELVRERYPYAERPFGDLTPSQFKQWLVGFSDGEATFSIRIDGTWVNWRYAIRLHTDDTAVRHKICATLGVGSVILHNDDSSSFRVNDAYQLWDWIVPIFDEHSLRTTKYLDYISWRAGLELRIAKPYRASYTADQLSWIISLVAGINRNRTTYDYSAIPNTPMTVYWLVGFIEGEGTFDFHQYRSPRFSITQNNRSLHVREDIRVYLASLPSRFPYSINTPPIKANIYLDEKDDCSTLSFGNVGCIHDIFIPHLLQCPFQARKAVDFHYWCFGVYMLKHGYAYLPEGKALLVAIYNHMNKGRVSTSEESDKADAPILSRDIFDIDLPIFLTRTIDTRILAQAYAYLNKDKKEIWVYDNEVLVEGSPFDSYTAAGAAINTSGNAVSRGFDTGRLVKRRYSIVSKRIPSYH